LEKSEIKNKELTINQRYNHL